MLATLKKNRGNSQLDVNSNERLFARNLQVVGSVLLFAVSRIRFKQSLLEIVVDANSAKTNGIFRFSIDLYNRTHG